MEETKETIIDKIIEKELAMFTAVNAREGQECQERPNTFKIMRWMSHSALSSDTLRSYLKDLEEAQENGRNLVTEKYARMENLIPPLQYNNRIFEIAEVEWEWIKDLSERFPHTVKGDQESFRTYILCELETFSEETLEFYWKDVRAAKLTGGNLAEARYRNLFKRLGHGTLEEVEAKAASGA